MLFLRLLTFKSTHKNLNKKYRLKSLCLNFNKIQQYLLTLTSLYLDLK